MRYGRFEEMVLDAAHEMGLSEYELYYQKDQSDEVSVFEGEVDQFASSVSEGVCFRCRWKGKIGFASTELLEEREAWRMVEAAVASAEATDTVDAAVFVAEGPECLPVTSAEADTAGAVSMALDCEKAAAAGDSRITKVETTVAQVSQLVRITNSAGLRLEKGGSMALSMASVVAAEGEETTTDYKVDTAASVDKLDVAETARGAVSKAVAQLGGKPMETGSWPVVFSPSQMGMLLEVFAPVFSAKNAQDGLSRLKDQEEKAVASPMVTIWDDPCHPDSCFPSPFDAEGVSTSRRAVVEKGTLSTLLHNQFTAGRAGVQSTGNASKSSYAAPVEISPFTFYLEPGDCAPEALYQQAGDGVYITFMKGAHAGANPVTGDFSLEARGFRIDGGKLTTPVQGITVAGNFFDLLAHVEGVANDLQIDFSGGPTAYGAPSVLVTGLTVAGA